MVGVRKALCRTYVLGLSSTMISATLSEEKKLHYHVASILCGDLKPLREQQSDEAYSHRACPKPPEGSCTTPSEEHPTSHCGCMVVGPRHEFWHLSGPRHAL
jgi:hypothetical protein